MTTRKFCDDAPVSYEVQDGTAREKQRMIDKAFIAALLPLVRDQGVTATDVRDYLRAVHTHAELTAAAYPSRALYARMLEAELHDAS